MLHGQTRYNLRSRFFDELPEASLKWLTPRVQGPRAAWGSGYAAAWEGFDTTPARPRDADTGRADAAARRAAQSFDRGLAWRVGQSVSHARFGDGVIIELEGRGDDARAQINFGPQGVKWLALSVARLSPR
jgi:DNA helicase-2/ATP-dependent DNA helicase PcrA